MKISVTITRRKLAVLLASSGALAGNARAQTAAPAATPADALQAAKDRIKANSETLSKEPVPMAVEPAFQFKA